jgi:hypothetical protein
VKQSRESYSTGDITAAARPTDGLLFIAVTGHVHPTTFFDKDIPKAASALEAANNEIIEAAIASCEPSPESTGSAPRSVSS